MCKHLTSRSNWNWFLWREENRNKPKYPEKYPRSKDKNQQQTQPTYDTGTGNQTRATLVEGECSHHCAIPAPPTRNFTPHFLSPPRCINGYRRHTAGGNPTMDYHPIQEGVAILSVASCYRNRVKPRPCGLPVARVRLYLYLTLVRKQFSTTSSTLTRKLLAYLPTVPILSELSRFLSCKT